MPVPLSADGSWYPLARKLLNGPLPVASDKEVSIRASLGVPQGGWRIGFERNTRAGRLQVDPKATNSRHQDGGTG
jgi:hypothetical protein